QGNVKFAGSLEGARGVLYSEGIYDGDFTQTIIDRVIILEDNNYKHLIHPLLATIEDKRDNVIYRYGYGGVHVTHTNNQPIAAMSVHHSGYLSIYAFEGYKQL